MNNTTTIFNLLGVLAVAVAVACGGGSDGPVEDDPPMIAETVPVDVDGGTCIGEMPWYCEDVDLELCEDAGCTIRAYQEQDYAMCYGERPRSCEDLEARMLCEQMRGCEWIEE